MGGHAMLVRLPGTGLRVHVPDRRIPSAQLDRMVELGALDAEHEALRQAARDRVAAMESALMRQMRVRLAARTAIESVEGAVDIKRFIPELTTLVLGAVQTLIGSGGPGRGADEGEGEGAWQARAALHLASGLESIAAVELSVAPNVVEHVEARLAQALDMSEKARRFRVVADAAMSSQTCAVRCGDSCWLVDLDAWLVELREHARAGVTQLFAASPSQPVPAP